ncbi:nitrate reductase molybdenum cofactor assembly chaperone [Rubrobacter radiotolerans]|uniref:Nitrate reductase molybdenum cofactor assembly chaperone n=1 Tax=Rubrobacter radiotolerans TaxID=42256 RepID=A0AB35T126_RUBRA|nr:nitrate reductase molybdenum cofactor assembly chaperone [Rubrobacter radiotolerans]MDX5893272.1 nitrate reductase molybdenum cofactor assembly chaperone [Rubrobacter radiotolerans]SMC03404.1 respiratory nitrate reductase chaperone NarJ [Rubrobacter radiotolerans DSM 5868]
MIFKLLSLLLRYPDDEVLAARKPIADLARRLPFSPAGEPVFRFLDYWERTEPRKLQADYIETFDFSRRGSLYLTYYRYGDSRLRGEALVEVKEAYERAGYSLTTGELPDYLPLVLEFASEEPEEGIRLLAANRGPVELIRRSLLADGSPHAHLLDALASLLPDLAPEDVDELRTIVMQGPPQETVGLEPYGAEPKPPQPVIKLGRKRA